MPSSGSAWPSFVPPVEPQEEAPARSAPSRGQRRTLTAATGPADHGGGQHVTNEDKGIPERTPKFQDSRHVRGLKSGAPARKIAGRPADRCREPWINSGGFARAEFVSASRGPASCAARSRPF